VFPCVAVVCSAVLRVRRSDLRRNLRKVCLLLQAFEDAGKEIDYFALDLSRAELERTLAQVPPFKHVRCHGLWGTYDDGREWLQSPEVAARPKCILSLGSSIGMRILELPGGCMADMCSRQL
jgi:uncharacterized SAM-dependent methyltransferase